MSKKNNNQSKQPAPAPPQPVDVIDGIADRSGKSARVRYTIIAVIFAAWIAFLVYCQITSGSAK